MVLFGGIIFGPRDRPFDKALREAVMTTVPMSGPLQVLSGPGRQVTTWRIATE
jgi:hypothetical protein